MPRVRQSFRPRPTVQAHTPRKQFGQHFLTDQNILQKIVRAAEAPSDATVLEIGPGLGDLTRVLCAAAARVVAVEVDRDLAARLREEFAGTNAQILQGDILKQTPDAWLAQANAQPPYLVVANLPYYITSAILRYLLEAPTPPTRIVIMVQQEVAQQITATPPHSNLLAVSVQYYGTPRIVAHVPAGAFRPPPKVDSAVLRIDVHHTHSAADAKNFFRVARAGFSAKRKQIHNALANGLGISRAETKVLLSHARIAPTRRAETLHLDEWSDLAKAYAARVSP